jgi:hypothetical protein
MYTAMMTSENYVLKRQSLKLLSEFLLDRENFRVMMRYISDKANMKTIMMMLRHKQPNIQFEAFHVFKVRAPHMPHTPRWGLQGRHYKPFALLPTLTRLLAHTPSPCHCSLRRSRAGVCGQPREARGRRRDPGRQQGQAHQVPAGVPEREGCARSVWACVTAVR